MPSHSPTGIDRAAAYGRTVPDLLPDVPGALKVLLVGVNPGLVSGARGLHFGNPANRLWTVLHRAGLTSRRLQPEDTEQLLAAGIGITNLVNRATARADELTAAELRDAVPRLTRLVERVRPGKVAVLGISASRVAFVEPRATVGRQSRTIAGRPLWLLPNPSGLNASYQLDALVAAYAELRD
jgi:double-stranded uracil-DNA glycosylase